MSGGVLAEILRAKHAEVAGLRGAAPPRASREPLDARAALRDPGALCLIAEIKRRSPSAGELSRAMTPAERALAYANAGARMVSVLCDGPFFGGSYADLAAARGALDAAGRAVPLLAKEFVVDAVQLDHARGHGADAVLIIARILSPGALGGMVEASLARGLEPVVEVATSTELVRALATRARIIGVNARDLDTLAMDAAAAARVLARVPPERVAVHLSGLKTEADVRGVTRERADAALIGETLMREDDPSTILKRFTMAARRAGKVVEPGGPT